MAVVIEAKRVELPHEVTLDDSAIAALLQQAEDEGGYVDQDVQHPKPQGVLSESDVPVEDAIAKVSQTLCNSINQHYWEELYAFSKESDELEDDDVVRMTTADKAGFIVSVAPRKVRGKTVHRIMRRIDFQDHVFTEASFMHEFFEAVQDGVREGEYDEVNKLSRDLVGSGNVKVARDFAIRNHVPKSKPSKSKSKASRANAANSAAIGPNEEQLLANKAASKAFMYIRCAPMSELGLSADDRSEQLIKVHKHEKLSVALLCKKANQKFRLKGKLSFVSTYDSLGQSIHNKTALSKLTGGDVVFFSPRRSAGVDVTGVSADAAVAAAAAAAETVEQEEEEKDGSEEDQEEEQEAAATAEPATAASSSTRVASASSSSVAVTSSSVLSTSSRSSSAVVSSSSIAGPAGSEMSAAVSGDYVLV